MQQTSNYQSSQWDAEDRIQREDFNSDNAKVDAALAVAKAERDALAAAVADCGNCRIVTGSYTGSGLYGASNPNILTFDGKPLLLAIMPSSNVGNSAKGFLAVRGSSFTYTYPGNYNSINQVTWGDRSVEWYCADSAQYQFNNMTHYFVALLAPAE